MPKPLPTMVTELTVNAAVPEEVKVSVLVEAVFNTTLPKLRALGLTVNCGAAGAVPVPLKDTVAGFPVEELLETVMVPVAAPGSAGSKLTCSVID